MDFSIVANEFRLAQRTDPAHLLLPIDASIICCCPVIGPLLLDRPIVAQCDGPPQFECLTERHLTKPLRPVV
jgi:hypothetical protein